MEIECAVAGVKDMMNVAQPAMGLQELPQMRCDYYKNLMSLYDVDDFVVLVTRILFRFYDYFNDDTKYK